MGNPCKGCFEYDRCHHITKCHQRLQYEASIVRIRTRLKEESEELRRESERVFKTDISAGQAD